MADYSKGVSPKGLLNEGSSPKPFLSPFLEPPLLPLGGGLGGISVIITREMELSMSNLNISGFI